MTKACADQELLLGGLIDGELDAANIAMVEAHVLRCDDCRNELERLYRDVRSGPFHPPNSDAAHDLIGRTYLGVLGG